MSPINLPTRRHRLLRLLLHPHPQLFIDLFLRLVLTHVMDDLQR